MVVLGFLVSLLIVLIGLWQAREAGIARDWYSVRGWSSIGGAGLIFALVLGRLLAS